MRGNGFGASAPRGKALAGQGERGILMQNHRNGHEWGYGLGRGGRGVAIVGFWGERRFKAGLLLIGSDRSSH